MGKRTETLEELIVSRIIRLGKAATITITNSDGTESSIDLTELAALDSIAADDLAKIDGITNGASAAGKAVVLDSNQDFDNDAGLMRNTGATLATEGGNGVVGIAEQYASRVEDVGGLKKTTIFIDLTGLRSTAAGDIIGDDGTSNPCHLGQIVAADSGTIVAVSVTCLEAPAGGDPDIDLYSADEATGSEDDAISGLSNTVQLTNGGDHVAGDVDPTNGVPTANQYLYLVAGATTDADYTAGKLLIELWGV